MAARRKLNTTTSATVSANVMSFVSMPSSLSTPPTPSISTTSISLSKLGEMREAWAPSRYNQADWNVARNRVRNLALFCQKTSYLGFQNPFRKYHYIKNLEGWLAWCPEHDKDIRTFPGALSTDNYNSFAFAET